MLFLLPRGQAMAFLLVLFPISQLSLASCLTKPENRQASASLREAKLFVSPVRCTQLKACLYVPASRAKIAKGYSSTSLLFLVCPVLRRSGPVFHCACQNTTTDSPWRPWREKSFSFRIPRSDFRVCQHLPQFTCETWQTSCTRYTNTAASRARQGRILLGSFPD